MKRRLTTFELQAAQAHRDEAREYLGELFPRLTLTGVQLGICRDGGSVAVRAQVNDTNPYPRPAIIDALGQLGVETAPSDAQL